MVTQYISQFQQWYDNLSYEDYRNHYLAWRSRDACKVQEEIVRRLLIGKQFPLVFDMSYGGGEYSHIISHDRWVKSAVDEKQEALIRETSPNVEIVRVEHPFRPHGGHSDRPDLTVVMNTTRNVDIKIQHLRDLLRAGKTALAKLRSNVLLDFIASDEPWVGMNDRSMDKKEMLRFMDNWQMLPRHYWEFPEGVDWYIGYLNTDGFDWIPGGKESLLRQRDIAAGELTPQEAALAAISYAYTDISDKKILDLSLLPLQGLDVHTASVDDLLNLQLTERYNIVLCLGLLSRIEQYSEFAKYIVSHIDADTYIFSGPESAIGITPEYLYDEQGQVCEAVHPYKHYVFCSKRIKREFGYSTYVMRGPKPEDLVVDARAYRGHEVYIVVEAAFQIPESIVRTLEYEGQ